MSLFGIDGFNQAMGSIATGLITTAGSAHAARKAYKYNRRLIEMQQNWQERMSNTAHQREVSDMRAAGLNPMLSVMGGNGASFGSASAPGMSVENPVEAGLNTALAYRQQKNQDKISEAQKDNLNADSYLKGNQANTESERFNTQIVQTQELLQNIENSKALTSAQVDYYKKQGEAAIRNALSNELNANTARYTGNAQAEYNRELAKYHGAQNPWTRGQWFGEKIRRIRNSGHYQ